MARQSGRQYPLVLTIDLDPTNVLLAGSALGQLPPNATITDAWLYVDTAWDDTGAATVTVTVDTDTLFTTANLEATGITDSFTRSGLQHTVADDVTVTLAAGNEDATVGAARLNIEYIIAGRANEVGEPGA